MEATMSDNKPMLIAYAVKDAGGGDRKATWTRIGAAWAHDKGPGNSIRLDALPVDGRIVLIEPTALKAANEG
jgi:hypothetical protein